MKISTHEDLTRRQELQMPTDRSFGVIFTIVFLLVGLWPLRKSGAIRWWSIALSFGIAVIVLVRPSVLHSLNRAWAQFSLLLAKVVNPIVMSVLFLGVITPLAVMLRCLGKDSLRLRLDPSAESYWLPRVPPGPAPEEMSNQF